jgi:tRNA-(ms[2]io[6]A)-hydroxylase
MLRAATPRAWVDTVLDSFDEFLNDHAANERKASAVAMSLVAHYPDKARLLSEMVDLALEELGHYRQVIKLMLARNITPAPDEKDPYVNQLLKKIRKGPDDYFLDRLLVAAVIEARGTERFGLIATHHSDAQMRKFYGALEKSEANHHQLFLDLANDFFAAEVVSNRWQEWLELEAEIMLAQPIRARLH